MNHQANYSRALNAEPLIRQLHLKARDTKYIRRVDGFCRNALWNNEFKPLVVMLVGAGRGQETSRRVTGWGGKVTIVYLDSLGAPGVITKNPDPETEDWLRTTQAYDAVYNCMYDLLPACRGCGSFC